MQSLSCRSLSSLLGTHSIGCGLLPSVSVLLLLPCQRAAPGCKMGPPCPCQCSQHWAGQLHSNGQYPRSQLGASIYIWHDDDLCPPFMPRTAIGKLRISLTPFSIASACAHACMHKLCLDPHPRSASICCSPAAPLPGHCACTHLKETPKQVDVPLEMQFGTHSIRS